MTNITNKTQTTNTTTVQSKVTPTKPVQVVYTLGETFQHNGRAVQVVELQAQGVYHVKAMDAPFDSYWINTGESADITNDITAE